MTLDEKKRRCAGCRDDYYNHGGNSDTGYCWMLPEAKTVWRKLVHVDQRPPWDQKAVRVFNCYHKPRHITVDPKLTR